MIFKHNGKWMLKEGKSVRFFATEQAAKTAAGTQALNQMYEYAGADHGIQETKDYEKAEDYEEISDEDYEEVDTKE